MACHRFELRTVWIPWKIKVTSYQLSYHGIYDISQGIIMQIFLILLETKIFVLNMTPELLFVLCSYASNISFLANEAKIVRPLIKGIDPIFGNVTCITTGGLS